LAPCIVDNAAMSDIIRGLETALINPSNFLFLVVAGGVVGLVLLITSKLLQGGKHRNWSRGLSLLGQLVLAATTVVVLIGSGIAGSAARWLGSLSRSLDKF